jgi:ribosomal protein L11 methyltransferase
MESYKTTEYSIMTLPVTGFDRELLSAELFSQGCTGIEEFSEELWRIYFSESMSALQQKSLLEKLKTLNFSLRLNEIHFSVEPQQDWNAEWKKHYQPLKVTGRIWVAPPWQLPRLKKGEMLLTIDPQMAFGTGSHESTQLMIRAMEKYLTPGQRVLDAGTGSGILAILANKLGAAAVFAFDIEPEAIDNARHNAMINSADGIQFQAGDFSVVPDEKFDVILANINRNILLEMIPSFRGVLLPDGVLILSGILASDQEVLQKALSGWSEFLEKFNDKEWISLVYKKVV